MLFIVIYMTILMILLNMNIKLTGIPEQIMVGAIRAGLAKTKTGAITLGLMELENKYKLLEQQEDEEDLMEAKKIWADYKAGKVKLLSAEDFEKRTGIKVR